MHFKNIVLSLCLIAGISSATATVGSNTLKQRQDNTNPQFPTLGSGSTETFSSTTENTASATQSAEPTSASATGARNSVSQSPSETNATRTSRTPAILSTTAPTLTPAPDINHNGTTEEGSNEKGRLPLRPRITPALSIGGVFLILTGIVYALIGVKNRWIHIFLSTAYLTSVSITVLIVYVMNPPISNAIQGAYFVGILMTGVVFGSGALIFKEVTEGLGCLLGGFTLSMWFITLKEGGLITSPSGKAIFIGVFCLLAWSSSFSHYTRAYGLMGSTSFSGATAFVLGIDCFSRGGLKEFWVYIWGLNDDIFPLNTNTYPITRGTRVETVVIVLGCIIGIISQMKLWRVVRDRQRKKQEENQEEDRRRETVEAALGRHLERQNDRDRSQWERQYGNTLQAKRETILWSEAHGEKNRYSRISEAEVLGSQNSSSSESLEMSNMPRKPRSVYVARVKRHSNMAVDSIPEEGEQQQNQSLQRGGVNEVKEIQQQSTLDKLEGKTDDPKVLESSREIPPSQEKLQQKPVASSPALQDRDSRTRSMLLTASHHIEPVANANKASANGQFLDAPDDPQRKKRRSIISYFSSKSGKEGHDVESVPSVTASQEALVLPQTNFGHSRASSLAATVDYENEAIDVRTIDMSFTKAEKTPEIIVSPTHHRTSESNYAFRDFNATPEPPALEDDEDVDPEEMGRPTTVVESPNRDSKRISSGRSSMKRLSGPSEIGTDILFDNYGPKSHAATSETSHSEILTKGALEQVPSQLSNIVLSYRTNEWAKHIASADAPMYEEPQSMETQDEEIPVHLAAPEEAKKSATIQAPPPLSPAPLTTSVPHVEAALPSPTDGIKINPALQPVYVMPQRTESTSKSILVGQTRSASGSNKNAATLRGLRSSSTPMLVPTSQPAPIDENAPLELHRAQAPQRTVSTHSYIGQVSMGSPPLGNSGFNVGPYGSLSKSATRLSLVSEHGLNPARSASQMSQYGLLGQQQPNRSETRLLSYESHQPSRRNDMIEAQRREAMLADWRVSQQRMPSDQDQAEVHRQQMLYQRQQSKLMEEQEKTMRAQHDMAVDARMRSRDMQELHREAMRRMQAGANKKL